MFVPGQRWLSIAEPELGLGMIVQVEKNTILVSFPASDTQRRYGSKNPPLKRVKFGVGDTIQDYEDRTFEIREVVEEDGLVFYLGPDGLVSESELSDNTTFNNPQERFHLGQVDSNSLYTLRQECLKYRQWLMGHPARGYMGPRISLLPHQFSVASKICEMTRPRALLSDEVGLGKTIEAGIILHNLIIKERIERVVILVPDALVYQWFFELYRKFNLSFSVLNQESYRERGSQPFSESNLVITSLDFLRGSDMAREMFEQAAWDLVVVDEAHHLKWSPEEASPEYQIVEKVAAKTPGLLLLTATPQQLGMESHFARLKLIDHERFDDFDQFMQEMNSQKEWGDFAFNLVNKQEYSEDLYRKVNPDGNKSDEEVVESVIDLHGPGRVTFRNTREQLEGLEKELFNTRRLEPHPLEGNDFFKAKAEWLSEFLSRPEMLDKKCLLICKLKKHVIELDKHLRKTTTNLKWGSFHSDMGLTERDRQAAYFSQEDGARLLLCTEIGSEGRNFEFASELILFDLPLHPDLLEQRIGRLDRIGQKNPITIHVPWFKGGPEERLFEWYSDGMNAFLEQIQAGEEVLSEMKEEFNSYLQAAERDDELLAKVSEVNRKWKQVLSDGRDQLVEINSFRPREAFALVEHVRECDESDRLREFLEKVFSELGVDCEDLVEDRYRNMIYIRPGTNMYVPSFPGLPSEGMRATYSREVASQREDIHFLTWDHPMVTGAMDLILSQGFGNVTVARRKKQGPVKVFVEATFSWQVVAPKYLDINKYCPPQKLRTLLSESGENLSEKWHEEVLWPKLRPPTTIETQKSAGYSKEKLRGLLKKNQEIAEVMTAEFQESRIESIEEDVRKEVERLEELEDSHHREGAYKREIEFLELKRDLMLEAVRKSQLQLDSFAFIF